MSGYHSNGNWMNEDQRDSLRPAGKSKLVVKDGKIEKAVPVDATVDYWKSRSEALDGALDERLAEVRNLASLVERLCHRLYALSSAAIDLCSRLDDGLAEHDWGNCDEVDRLASDDTLLKQARDYLKRKGLQGSILREGK